MSKLTEKSYFPTLCWLIVAIIYMLQYGLLVIPSSVVSELKQDFGVNMSYVGIYAAMFLYAWVIMQLPAGLFFDRYNSRKLIFCSTLLLVVACGIQGVTTNYYWSLFSRFLMGGAGSFSFIGAIYLARSWYSSLMLPIIIGLTGGISGISEISFPVLFLEYKHSINWREIILIIGVITFIFAVLSWFFVHDKVTHEEKSKDRMLQDLRVVLTNKYLWGLGLYVGFAFTYFIVLADMWGLDWLVKQFGLTKIDAALMNSVTIFSFIIGCPLLGWLSRYIATPKLLLISMVVEYISLLLMDYSTHTVMSHIIVLVFLGLSTGGVMLAFDIAKEVVSERHYGLAVGFLNVFLCGVGVIITPIMGYVLMLSLGHGFYKPLIISMTGALGVIVAIFIAWRFRFETKA
ncbi:MAG: hypothetical protein COB66_06905 [Coxiella sp. (in: Bacteria)]|nr:MAG: hypothetical protein COB66_06905 [Coxiella sp. (in: g-proteobacteria)]